MQLEELDVSLCSVLWYCSKLAPYLSTRPQQRAKACMRRSTSLLLCFCEYILDSIRAREQPPPSMLHGGWWWHFVFHSMQYRVYRTLSVLGTRRCVGPLVATTAHTHMIVKKMTDHWIRTQNRSPQAKLHPCRQRYLYSPPMWKEGRRSEPCIQSQNLTVTVVRTWEKLWVVSCEITRVLRCPKLFFCFRCFYIIGANAPCTT